MAITDAELDEVRDWVGDTDPTDEQISDRYDIEGTAVKTALVFLVAVGRTCCKTRRSGTVPTIQSRGARRSMRSPI